MSDSPITSANCDTLVDYNLVADREIYANLVDRRDRIVGENAWCADEPSLPELLDFQRVLDRAYVHFQNGRLYNAYLLLTKPATRRLRASYYQVARAEYLIGKYFAGRSAARDKVKHKQPSSTAIKKIETLPQEKQPLLAEAADHYCRGAAAAKQIPDWALYAQLKSNESAACMGVDPKQLRRAYLTAVDALDAWRKLPISDLAEDDHFEFNLADAVGLRAQIVAEDKIAMDALERAEELLDDLSARRDIDTEWIANSAVFLDWDWAVIYKAQGNYRGAFKRILQCRKKSRDLANPINGGRLHRFIAVIAMACADDGGIAEFSKVRLLSAAERAIDEAYQLTQQRDDEQGYALICLADARYLALIKAKENRVAKIQEAEAIAQKLNDTALLGQVGTAWGDEYAFQGKNERARQCYKAVIADMTKFDFLELARFAEQRLKRL